MINFLQVLTWAAFVVAWVFLISAWRLHQKVRQQLKELETPPAAPPTNVRVVQPDRSEDPLELAYRALDNDVKGEARPRDIARRVMVVTPVAAVMAALDGKWPDWPGWRDRRRGAIRDAMYAELLGAFKAIRADFREYRRTHP